MASDLTSCIALLKGLSARLDRLPEEPNVFLCPIGKTAVLIRKQAMHDDTELLRRYVDCASEEAFTRFVENNLNVVYFSALRRTNGDVNLAQDIVQQVFSNLARNVRSVANHPIPAGWLYVATRNAAANLMRTERRRKARELLAISVQDSSSNTENPDWDRLRPQLDGAMDKLNDRDRDAVILRHLQGRPFAEVAGILRTSEDAARKRVTRALEKLRGHLARQGITSTSAALAVALSNQTGLAAPTGLAARVSVSSLAASGLAVSPPIFTLMSLSKTTMSIAGAIGILAIATAIFEFGMPNKSTLSLGGNDASVASHIEQPRPSLPIAEASTEKKPSTQYVDPSTVSGSYRLVLAGLDLTQEEREHLLALLSRKEGIALNLKADLLNTGNIVPVSAACSEAQKQIDAANLSIGGIYSEIQRILGDERFPRFRQLESALPACATLAAVEEKLGSNEPLSEGKTHKLIELLDPPHPRISGADSISLTSILKSGTGGIVFGTDLQSHRAAPITSQALLDAESFLSPAELTALKDVKRSWADSPRR